MQVQFALSVFGRQKFLLNKQLAVAVITKFLKKFANYNQNYNLNVWILDIDISLLQSRNVCIEAFVFIQAFVCHICRIKMCLLNSLVSFFSNFVPKMLAF